MKSNIFDVIVVGGGFYGCFVALEMKKRYDKVLIVEKEKSILLRASKVNQARVHNGYHYPRDIFTAHRSGINFNIFTTEFRKAISADFTNIYAISKNGSKSSTRHFLKVCKELNLPLKTATKYYKNLFDSDFIDEVFLVKEALYNSTELRKILARKLDNHGIQIYTKTAVEKVSKSPNGILVSLSTGEELSAKIVLNCTYSQINRLLTKSGIKQLPVTFELSELVVVQGPSELQNIGVTVMDGPFFSILPYYSTSYHLLSHVRYTPRFRWDYHDGNNDLIDNFMNYKFKSSFQLMYRDINRYMKILGDIKYKKSFFEIKTRLYGTETNDSRPILFEKHKEINNIFSILGSKIDNVYDLDISLKKIRVT